MTATVPVEHLVDPFCGVVRDVVDYPRLPGLPDRFVSCVASVGDTRRFAAWLSDRIAAGTAFGDRRAAWLAAVGEAVERYCGNNIPNDLPTATAAALARAGVDHLGPDDLPRFLPAQHAAAGFPYRPFTSDTEVRWVTGTDERGRSYLVPASWVYLNYHHGSRRTEPRTHHLNYAGIATGQGLADAAARALAECVERDAVMTWWMLDLPARPVDPASVPGLAADLAGCPFELRLIAPPSPFGLPVVGALLIDRENGVPAAGFSASDDPVRAARKAVQEALQVWIASRGLLEEDGSSFRAVRAGLFSTRAYLPFRAGRDYLTVSGERYSEIRDLAAQTQLWLDPRLHPLLERFRGVGSPVPVDAVSGADLAQARAALAAGGHRTVTVDLTTTDVAETGWAVARVMVTGLQPNSPAAFPYLGTRRLATAARSAGRPAPSPDTVTLTPLPHN